MKVFGKKTPHLLKSDCRNGHPFTPENTHIYSSKNKNGKYYTYRICKLCRLTRNSTWKLSKKYGITVEDYRETFERQGKACAICLRTEFTRLDVDHDHASGKFRGLLCINCNLGIGLLREDTDIIQRAVKYLWEHR